MVFELKSVFCGFSSRRSRVTPAPCSCTSKQQSIRRPTPPAILMPIRSEPDVREIVKMPSPEDHDVFFPKYASTGISDEDLTMGNSTTLVIPVTCGMCRTPEVPAIEYPTSARPKIEMKLPVFDSTDYDGPTVHLSEEQLFPDSTISPLPRSATAKSAFEDLVVTRSSRLGSQERNTTIGKMVRRNVTRGKTFLRKMRKPRILPQSPEHQRNSVLKRSLPSVQGTFV